MKYFLTLLLAFFSYSYYSQCSGFPATLAESTCGSGTPLASNNNNINGGDNYSYCGTNSSSPSFAGVNLNGGNLTVCGNMTITSGTFNSGNMIISCGSTVTFTGGLSLSSNIKIINYGKVIINGSLNFSNNGNCFYNETQNASLIVSGDITWPQNTSDNSYLKNNGYVSVGGNLHARNGVYYCSGNGAVLQTNTLTYGTGCGAPANRFTYNGASGTSIIRVNTGALLQGTFTASSNYAINRNNTAVFVTTCGSWGSAVVATNSPAFVIPSSPGPCVINVSGCFTALPVGLVSFEAVANNDQVDLYWSTESEHNNDYFTIERSADAQNWEFVLKSEGKGNSSQLRNYSETDFNPLRGISYYRLVQIDFDGTKTISEVKSVVIRPADSFTMYPNPAQDHVVLLPSENLSFSKIELLDAFGRIVSLQLEFDQLSKGEPFMLNIDELRAGVYSVAVNLSNGETKVQRLVVK